MRNGRFSYGAIPERHPTSESLNNGGKERGVDDDDLSCDSVDMELNERAGGNSSSCNHRCLIGQIPAVGLVCVLNLMMSVPFGSVYFPVEWGGDQSHDESAGSTWGSFPLAGKDILGIRMCLFASIVGQVVYTFKSTFKCAVAFQMVENIPFYHSIAFTCLSHQGNTIEALSTLCFVMALSSVIVGVSFYALGRFRLGKIVHFFPKHVLLGLIGGIGVFVIEVAIEMTMNCPFALSVNGIKQLAQHWNLVSLVLYLEAALLSLLAAIRWSGREVSSLISPVFFLLITPVFYAVMVVIHKDRDDLVDRGYFFPHLDAGGEAPPGSNKLLDDHVFDIWKVFDISNISWLSVHQSLPTIFCLVMFSLLHVPINIPALAVSTGTNADMNKEMIAHGWSNCLSGALGGLQNYMTYSNSVAYFRAGGFGRGSSVAIVLVMVLFFFVGPVIVPYIPRCMAGTLLLHIGVDLFREGVYEHFAEFDAIEYLGVWLVVIVMTLSSLEWGLVTGVFWALFTYTFQSGIYTNPVRGIMTAARLRSNKRRANEVASVLNDPDIGMGKVLIISLEGHLFFGNITQFDDAIKKQLASIDTWIVILDFTHVTSIDCSFAEAITKLKDTLHRSYDVQLIVFVSGSHKGFPCKYDLTSKLPSRSATVGVCYDTFVEKHTQNGDAGEKVLDRAGGTRTKVPCDQASKPMTLFRSSSILLKPQKISGDYVCTNLNAALLFCEDALIAWGKPDFRASHHAIVIDGEKVVDLERQDDTEADIALRQLRALCPSVDDDLLRQFFSHFDRETWDHSEILWSHGDESDCVKLLVAGSVVSMLEEQDERHGEVVEGGAVIGELGVVTGDPRLSTVKCLQDCIMYNLSRFEWERIIQQSPELETILYKITVPYLSNKLKLISGGLFESRRARMPI